MTYRPLAIYNIWYKEGIERHDIQQIQRIREKTRTALNRISETKNQEEAEMVAERLLHNLSFDAEAYRSAKMQLGKHSARADSLLSSEIENVHRACSDAIRSKWHKPMMSDGELADYFFRQEVAPMVADSLTGKKEQYIVKIAL